MLPRETTAALGGFVDRIEHLHEQRDDLNGDIKAVYAEVKSAGFDTTVVRQVVRERRMEADARHALYRTLDDYRDALGMLAGTPLGEAAMTAAANGKDDASDHLQVFNGAAPRRRGRPRKPFAEQPVGGRKPGRPRGAAAIAAGRAHLEGESDPIDDALTRQ
jgi:uncharacterized protein (UPF0335 family)